MTGGGQSGKEKKKRDNYSHVSCIYCSDNKVSNICRLDECNIVK